MNIRAKITTGKIEQQSTTKDFVCTIEVNGVWSGDLYRPTREELESLCDHIKTKTNVK